MQYGGSVELRSSARLWGRDNALTLGAAWQGDHAHFIQSSQFGYLTPDRAVVTVAGPGAFAEGTQASENAFDARVDIMGRTEGVSAFVTDTLAVMRRANVTLSVRYDHTAIHNRDALTPGGGAGSLDGDYRFDHVNPAGTVLYRPSSGVTLHASLGQTSRAPPAIELGCADPASPCRLPNALAGDPPLRQVTTRTAEIGARGEAFDRALTCSVTGFRARNRDDNLFVADSASG